MREMSKRNVDLEKEFIGKWARKLMRLVESHLSVERRSRAGKSSGKWRYFSQGTEEIIWQKEKSLYGAGDGKEECGAQELY